MRSPVSKTQAAHPLLNPRHREGKALWASLLKREGSDQTKGGDRIYFNHGVADAGTGTPEALPGLGSEHLTSGHLRPRAPGTEPSKERKQTFRRFCQAVCCFLCW